MRLYSVALPGRGHWSRCGRVDAVSRLRDSRERRAIQEAPAPVRVIQQMLIAESQPPEAPRRSAEAENFWAFFYFTLFHVASNGTR